MNMESLRPPRKKAGSTTQTTIGGAGRRKRPAQRVGMPPRKYERGSWSRPRENTLVRMHQDCQAMAQDLRRRAERIRPEGKHITIWKDEKNKILELSQSQEKIGLLSVDG